MGPLVASETNVPDLEEPLITPSSSVSQSVADEDTRAIFKARRDGVFNLTKAVLGAGLMTLPRSTALLGSALSSFLLTAVGWLTFWTIKGLIAGSSDSHGRLRHTAYASLVNTMVGGWANKVLCAAIAIQTIGFEVSYLDIIGDILLGSPRNPGLLSGLLPLLPPGLTWLGLRQVVLAVTVAAVLLPLCCRRNMRSLGPVNVVGLVALAAFGLALVWLAVAAVAAGQAHPLPWAPDTSALGPSLSVRLMHITSILAILLTSDACQQNIHPLMAITQPYSPATMTVIVGVTVTVCTTFYAVVCAAAYLVFGPGLEDDVLTNLNTAAMTPLVGGAVAVVLSCTVRLGYLISLVGSAVLAMFPLRQSLAELLRQSPEAQASTFLPLTCTILALTYLLAVGLPSIWVVISLVGSVTATIVSFIMPALIIMRHRNKATTSHLLSRAAAVLVALLGLVIFLNGFTILFLPPQPSSGADNSPVHSSHWMGQALPFSWALKTLAA